MKDEHYGREFNVTMPKGAYDDLLKYKQAVDESKCIWTDYLRVYVVSNDDVIYELNKEMEKYKTLYYDIKKTTQEKGKTTLRMLSETKSQSCKCWLCRIFG